MAAVIPKTGQTIETRDGRQGIVRYIGELHIADGEWLGLELADANGKNDGSVKGERYFTCKPGYGIFVRKESVVKVVKQAVPAAAPRVASKPAASNPTSTVRSRPSSGIAPDVARKRQSLMSAGSTGTIGSRLSVKTPTKAPIKSLSSTTTSKVSTPRTGTPATTNRTSDSSTKSRMSMSSKATSIGPPSTATRLTSHVSRPSIGGTVQKPARPSSITTRSSMASKRLSSQPQVATKQDEPDPDSEQEEPILSPDIDEEEEEEEEPLAIDNPPVNGQVQGETLPPKTTDLYSPTQPLASRTVRTTSLSRNNAPGAVEARAAQVRETEQLKAKIRTLERQRQDDEASLKQVENLQGENERFKNIIQALQNKIKPVQQELADLRTKYAEAEVKINAAPVPSAEHESELELATLDKEMAEERAETFQMELEALKAKHEELELEVEIIREENRELGSVMSPEEKASAGWLQMERERGRLRDALVMLRDMTQETEASLRGEIKELQVNLEEVETTAGLYIETADKLNRAEETNRHLMGQLEAVESNDEVVEAMEAQKEQHLNAIEMLKKQIQDYEEHIQVTDELENFHVDEERRLHAQLDEVEAMLNESSRQNVEQDRVIEDLEYTLTKFRDVVQGLQADIDELRRSREISELQANEMSSKSRAMMDLNLRLQNSAAKSQAKVIETELNRVKAELATKHIDILKLFTLESYDREKAPTLALLCFSRLKAKANLTSKLLNERLREKSHLNNGEETFRSFEVMERMQWIAGTCERFESFMNTCNPQDFIACGGALYDLEPVERMVTAWIEALKRDELGTDGPEHLKRMQGVLVDLAEKLIIEDNESKATEVITQTQMVEHYAESLGGQLGALLRVVQGKLGGPRDEDDESMVFDKKVDQLATKARTIKFLTSKITQQLNDTRASKMCLGETSWILFEDAERETGSIAQHLRQICSSVAEEVSKFEPEQPLSYTSMVDMMTATAQTLSGQQSNGINGSHAHEDVFALFARRLHNLQNTVDNMSSQASDLNSTTEFEPKPAPWTVRARELKSQTKVAPEIQDELVRLERRNQELGSRITERERTIEEMTMRVDLAEKRMKDSRARDDKDKALQEEIELLKGEREKTAKAMSELRTELELQSQKDDQTQLELETLRKAVNGEVVQISGTTGTPDEGIMQQVQVEVNLLKAEIAALQAGLRFLSEENRSLRIPISETLMDAAKRSWLDTSSLDLQTRKHVSNKRLQKHRLEREAQDVYSNLIDLASSLKPVKLAAKRFTSALDATSLMSPLTPTTPLVATWQPMSQTTRYTVLRQKEELERWDAWRSDVVRDVKMVSSKTRSNTSANTSKKPLPNRTRNSASIPKQDGSNLAADPNTDKGPDMIKPNYDGVPTSEAVRIVEP